MSARESRGEAWRRVKAILTCTPQKSMSIRTIQTPVTTATNSLYPHSSRLAIGIFHLHRDMSPPTRLPETSNHSDLHCSNSALATMVYFLFLGYSLRHRSPFLITANSSQYPHPIPPGPCNDHIHLHSIITATDHHCPCPT